MTSELAAEAKRLNQSLWRMLWRGGSYASEAPLRIHSRDLDSGGAPALHPQFIAWLTDAGSCFCEPREVDGYMIFRHTCDRRFAETPARFRRSRNVSHARRLNRALRQLRLISPAEHNIVRLMLVHGRSWDHAMGDVNDSRLRRGEDAYTVEEFMVLAIAGFSVLVEAW